MPPTGLAAVIKRRWYLAVVGAIITLGLCAAAFGAFPAQYQAKAVVLLLPPASASVSGSQSAAGQNPYVSLGLVDGLNDVLAQAMTDSATGSVLLNAGLQGTYTVENDPATSGPLILITGTAKTSIMAVAITNRIVALVPATLLRLQQAAGVLDAKNNVTSTVLNPADTTIKVRKNQERGIIAAGVVGVVLTLLIIAATDKILLGRRRRAAEVGQDSADADPAVVEEAPDDIAESAAQDSAPASALEPLELTPLIQPAAAVVTVADEPAQDVPEVAPAAQVADPTDTTHPTGTDGPTEAVHPNAIGDTTDGAEAVDQPNDDAGASDNGATAPAPANGSAREYERPKAGPSATPQRRPESSWRLKAGTRNPARERNINRNGRPQPSYDSDQAAKSPDEISRSV